MAIGKAKTQADVIEIAELDSETIELTVVGKQPLILNKLSQKARQELLYPSGRKTTADRANMMKHNPVQEFRDSAHRLEEEDAETLLAFPSGGMKKALALAALRSGGISKTELNQLCWVEGAMIPIYGVPKLFMSITRQAGINSTPDIRTRCIVPQWTSTFRVSFVRPNLHAKAIANLAQAAGLVSGIGDWRPEKGAGTFGQFTLTDHDNAMAERIREEGGREAQIAAMESAEPYDAETEELLEWFNSEKDRRGRK